MFDYLKNAWTSLKAAVKKVWNEKFQMAKQAYGVQPEDDSIVNKGTTLKQKVCTWLAIIVAALATVSGLVDLLVQKGVNVCAANDVPLAGTMVLGLVTILLVVSLAPAALLYAYALCAVIDWSIRTATPCSANMA